MNAISCTALAPASRKCAPATEIALNLGTSAAQNSMVSAIRRRDGSAGQIQVPREAYSLRMSFWMVPVSFSRGTPLRSAAAT
ncbi:hypothetical protein M2158_005181 [Streptomyces sp. SAI-144]|nr:hypothetical protein [Streptomyces sp. SAI-144]